LFPKINGLFKKLTVFFSIISTTKGGKKSEKSHDVFCEQPQREESERKEGGFFNRNSVVIE
jgi:hypothetical protein